MAISIQQQGRALLDFIDNSPSPWHAVETIAKQLETFAFTHLYEQDQWSLESGGRYYVIRDDSSIIFFVRGHQSIPEAGFKIIGAHTDSPGLRIKPNAAHDSGGMLRLGVEVYGGPILATFTDRDLSLAGRISYSTETKQIATHLLRFTKPLLRLPNLAIHMNRKVNEEGLKLDKQNELPLLLAVLSEEQLPPSQEFLSLLEKAAIIEKDRILSWELNVYDTQQGQFWGADEQFLADSQLDNLASCHAALTALLDSLGRTTESTSVCAFFDHEEIGSESTKGADGGFLRDTLERITLSGSFHREDFHRALAQSFMISADMAHAYQPNFPSAYEPEHHVLVNHGPVIKVNANHRYTSESISEAMFINWCEQAGVPHQKYSHRTDIPCGSTIGPMSSARLGIRSVDVGCPMWAMHSARESAGVLDHDYMIKVMDCFFADQ
jgi:aspartyl aminopeptidase